jgi:2-oxoisovalerate dehydrogenase E2 component (dihydrolipoyl transacylase)
VPIVIFNLPDLGEGLPDAEIVEWHAKDGDPIKQGDLLVSVETDKAVVEVPSPHSGTLVKAYGRPGDILKVGTPLAEFETEAAAAEPGVVPGDAGNVEDAGTVVGRVETKSTTVREPSAAVSPEASEVRATPAVRALAKRLNVDLSVVKPSGPGGVVAADDVKRVANVLADLGPIEPLRGVRRAMARIMALAHEQVVPVTIHDDADIDHWSGHDDISLRLIRAIVAGNHAQPGLNAWYDAQSVGRRVLANIDLGIAVDTADGLLVPVLKNVGAFTADDLRRELESLKAAVKSRTIPLQAMRGATFTLSNFGTLAGKYATPIVVPPAVAILGSGSTREAVVPWRGEPVVHKIIPLSLTFDHRCITGGEAARFLHAVIDDLQKPATE